MSYILDALKKLEHEKSRKSARNGMVNISGALFENERPRPSGTAGWKVVIVVTAAVLVTFGVTWQLLRPAKGRENSVPHLATPLPATPPAPVAVPLPPPVTPVIPVQESSPPPVVATPIRVPAHAPKLQKTAPAALPRVQVQPTRTKENKTRAVSVDQTMPAPTDIQLSGIAWQEERRARRAVVNGFLMQEGGVVSGARITDIYQERVRFSLSGKIFEIPLVSSAVPAAGK